MPLRMVKGIRLVRNPASFTLLRRWSRKIKKPAFVACRLADQLNQKKKTSYWVFRDLRYQGIWERNEQILDRLLTALQIGDLVSMLKRGYCGSFDNFRYRASGLLKFLGRVALIGK